VKIFIAIYILQTEVKHMPKIIDGDVLNYLQNKLKDNYATKDGDLHLQEKEINYSNEVQTIVPDTGYNGISKVKLPGLKLEETTVKSTKVQQEIYPEADANRDSYIKKVTVQPRTLQEKSVDIAAITEGTPYTPTVIEPDENFNGLSKVTATSVVNMQSKTANYSNQTQEITADEGYSGLSSVTLQPYLKLYDSMTSLGGNYSKKGIDITDNDLPMNMTELELNEDNSIGLSSITSNNLTKLTLNYLNARGIQDKYPSDRTAYYCVNYDLPNAKMIINCNIYSFKIYNVAEVELLSNYSVNGSSGADQYGTIYRGHVYCPIVVTKVANNEIKSNSFFLVHHHNNPIVITDNNITKVKKDGFRNAFYVPSITLPDSIIEFEESAFRSVSGLIAFNCPTSLQKIGDYCFYYCSKLETITIQDSVTEIGQYAFGNCSSLQEIRLPDGLTTINNSMFSECRSLKNISLGSDISQIANRVFYNCTSLATITVRGNSSCATAQILQVMDPAIYNNATIIYTEE
jgi:hypothetical protein